MTSGLEMALEGSEDALAGPEVRLLPPSSVLSPPPFVLPAGVTIFGVEGGPSCIEAGVCNPLGVPRLRSFVAGSGESGQIPTFRRRSLVAVASLRAPNISSSLMLSVDFLPDTTAVSASSFPPALSLA